MALINSTGEEMVMRKRRQSGNLWSRMTRMRKERTWCVTITWVAAANEATPSLDASRPGQPLLTSPHQIFLLKSVLEIETYMYCQIDYHLFSASGRLNRYWWLMLLLFFKQKDILAQRLPYPFSCFHFEGALHGRRNINTMYIALRFPIFWLYFGYFLNYVLCYIC